MSQAGSLSSGGGGGGAIDTITSSNLLVNTSGTNVDIEDLLFTTRFVVDKLVTIGNAAPYQTIAAAVTAANAAGGGTVFVRQATTPYAESFTLPGGVSLYSYPSIPSIFGSLVGAVIDGTVTLAGGETTITGICLSSSGAYPALDVSGSNGGVCFINNCLIEGGSVAAITFEDHSAQVIMNNNVHVSTGSDFISSTASAFYITNAQFVSVGGGTPGIILTGSNAAGTILYSNIGGLLNLSSSASIELKYSQVNNVILNGASSSEFDYCQININQTTGTGVAITNGGTHAISFSSIGGDTTSAVTIDSSSAANIDFSNISSVGATYAISGTGALGYGIIDFTNSITGIDPGLFLNLNVVRPVSQAVSATLGARAGLSYFNSSDFTVDSTGFVSAIGGSGTAPNYTTVDHAMSPYTVLTNDYYLAVDSSAGAVLLQFPGSATSKQTWVVKDMAGQAMTNNITLGTVSGTPKFDGSTTYELDDAYEAVQVLANPTGNYELY